MALVPDFRTSYIATEMMFAGEECDLCRELIRDGDALLLDDRTAFVEAAHRLCVERSHAK